MIWKQRITPAGRLIYALRASARRTSGKGCTGWPTPVAEQANGTPEAFLRRKRESVARGNSMGICLSDLNMVAQAALAGWPTPNVPNGGRQPAEGTISSTGQSAKGKRQVDLGMVAQLAGWHTPEAHERTFSPRKCAHGTVPLANQAQLAGWATPAARDFKGIDQNYCKGEINNSLPNQIAALGPTPESSSAGTGKPAAYLLNPRFSLWLQGYSAEFIFCAERAIQSCRPLRRSSSKYT